MRATALVALAATLSTVSAAHQGFNYGATNSDGSIKDQQRFKDEFITARNLVGASGFTSARLYTSIQGGTAQDPISAIPAAIESDTTLLLGIWCSAGQDIVNNEIAALKNAIAKYGDDFTSLVTGLSVGSEDLYRISPTGVAAGSDPGVEPDQLVSYINQVRSALADTPLKNVPIGHVDTWNDWVNGANRAVIEAIDWIGVDAYPYFQTAMDNTIENGPRLFFEAYDATVAVAGGKDVWITETGWPVSGKDSGKAKANLENAKYFWDNVACPSLGKINTYWYTFQDSYPLTPNPSFGVIGTTLSTTPLFDLSCPAGGSTSVVTPTSTKDTTTTPVPTSNIVSSGDGLTPTHGPGNGGDDGNGGVGGGSGNASSIPTTMSTSFGTTITSPTGGADGSDVVSPTGNASGPDTASPTGGAGGPAGTGSVSPTGGAGGNNGSESDGSSPQPTGSNATVISPVPTSSPTIVAPNAAVGNAGAGVFALGAAIMAAVAAF